MTDVDKIIQEASPHYKKKGKPGIAHTLVLDTATQTLEPLYFWILDYIGKFYKNVDKVVDNFASSPGSGHFSELWGKRSQMQQEASRILGNVNNVLKAVLNLIYDLKEFKIRLSHYEAAQSDNKEKKQAGILALKQIWMDKVDVQRGQGSINALTAGDLNFVTLRDAFMSAQSVQQAEKLDLNERVKRILKPRLQEFFEWKKRSYQELQKRFKIEKTYLKSEVDVLKLYSKWAKPYLKAAQQLEEDEGLQKDAALVTAFNTVLLQLTLMAYDKINIESQVLSYPHYLPEGFVKLDEKGKIRKFYEVVTVDFKFRGIPQKAGQHYVFGGRADIDFKSYGLNEDELELIKYKLSQSDLEDALKLVSGMTDESLATLQDDINEFLEEDADEEEAKKEDTNPFTALFTFSSEEKKREKPKTEEEIVLEKRKKLDKEGIRPDSYAEQYVRNIAEADAKDSGFDFYDIFKKSLGMGSVRAWGEKGKKFFPPTLAPPTFAATLLGLRGR